MVGSTAVTMPLTVGSAVRILNVPSVTRPEAAGIFASVHPQQIFLSPKSLQARNTLTRLFTGFASADGVSLWLAGAATWKLEGEKGCRGG
jgi:hypothetical protein